MRKLSLAAVLFLFSVPAFAQMATVRVQGQTLDAAGVTGTVSGTLVVSGNFSQMNIATWNLTINGTVLKPTKSSFAGKAANSWLLRPGNSVRAFYMFVNDGRVLFLMVPDSFFRDNEVVGDHVAIFPVCVDVNGNYLQVYGSGLYHSSYMPVVQITTATMRVTKIKP